MSLLPIGAWASINVPYFLLEPSEEIHLGTIVLTAPAGNLLQNGVPVNQASNWSLFPTLSNVITFSPSFVLQVVNGALYFNDSLIAEQSNISNVSDWYLYPSLTGNVLLGTTSNILNGSTSNLLYNGANIMPSQWSVYPAIQDVNMSNKNISNANTLRVQAITSIGGSNAPANVALSASNNISIHPSNQLNMDCQSGTWNVGYSLLDPSVLTLQTSYGTYGAINLLANAGYAPTNPQGRIAMTANGAIGLGGSIGYGGSIDLVANSAFGTLSNLTSAIRLNAASVLSYAGAVPPIGSLAGYNYTYGNVGVSIVAGIPSFLPNFPGTIFMQALTGVEIQSVDGNGLYCSDFRPYTDGLTTSDLTIQGRATTFTGIIPLIANVVISNCKTLNGMCWEADPSNPFNALLVSNLEITGLTKINGSNYVPVSQWSYYHATCNLDMSNHLISNCLEIDFLSNHNLYLSNNRFKTSNSTTIETFAYLSDISSTSSLVFSNLEISNHLTVDTQTTLLGTTSIVNATITNLNMSNTAISNASTIGLGISTLSYSGRMVVTQGLASNSVAYLSDFTNISNTTIATGELYVSGNSYLHSLDLSNGALTSVSSLQLGIPGNRCVTTYSNARLNVMNISGSQQIAYLSDIASASIAVNINQTTLTQASLNKIFVFTGGNKNLSVSGLSDGWCVFVKNGNPSGGSGDITLQVNSTAISGPTSGIIHQNTTGANAMMCVLTYSGGTYTLY